MTEKKGIQRHESLHSLSHHHHEGLFLALNLKRVETKKARYSLEQTAADVKNFWVPGGKQHFREEEEILLPAYAEYGPVDLPEIKTMLVDHIRIRAMMESIIHNDTPSPDAMHELGERLETHIRLEERVIFPYIEETLPEEKLQELARRLEG
ncbi:hemerythrin domain-containing protein [Salibacterium qingdaonense]|uniref:Hemerythrin HHE cation binding domain-containing protein n=1 Tax=Salibacterium qingdaonense TaxID=266892 RepID=A0A1I4MZJ4_9BACI|nr:hemerythrin domain-containing protein [Salibacterium qingdaonense]SFM08709.1 Hemerythrin HHE cation binding domain-containing protein [Salibacterium qingdaonense]